MDSLTALVAALAEVAALRDKLTVRGVHVHCMWCRAVVGEVHHNGSPDAQKDALDVAQRLAEEHDPTCPKNPYTAEIVRLRRELAAANEDARGLAEAAEAWITDMDHDAKDKPASIAAHLAAEMRRRFGVALSAHRARVGG